MRPATHRNLLRIGSSRVKSWSAFVGITLVVLGATSISAAAQEPKRIEVVFQSGPYSAAVEGLREGLRATGLEDGKGIVLLLREMKRDPAAAAATARELERDRADVIVALTSFVTRATQNATTNVPIVFAVGNDPIAAGFVESIAKPGGRLTGVYFLVTELTTKRLGLLREMAPTLRRIVTFQHPDASARGLVEDDVRNAARTANIDFTSHEVTSEADIRARLIRLAASDAYFFVTDSFVNRYGTVIVDAANSLKLPTMGYELDIVAKGALAGYGLNYREVGRLMARHVSRILASTPPSDLPVELITRPALAINLKTARALGLTVPPNILAQADELIE